MTPDAVDLRRLKVFPLASRESLTRVEEVLLDPDAPPPALSTEQARLLDRCVEDVRRARESGAGVALIYGAHLLRNGAAGILGRMMREGWLTHLATNGAGSIHDWEYAWLGRSTESVRANVATGTFGAWDETGRYLHLALMAGALRGEGYGASIGRLIAEDGVTIPSPDELETLLRSDPSNPLAPARAELLLAVHSHGLPSGRIALTHRWKHASILGQAFENGVPATVHPGIGYDIISNPPMFNGGAIGRAGGLDFQRFVASVATLQGGVVLSVGSAIMGPQVFEKSLSCVNNLRLQDGRPILSGHAIHVVDLQEGGGWDWSVGEPPKSNPAYYLRFCKSYARMGGAMHYHCCDNAAFLQNLHQRLRSK
jgi:hypothetical protein